MRHHLTQHLTRQVIGRWIAPSVIAVTTLAASLVWTCSPLAAAELRMTIGDREVHRAVAFEEPLLASDSWVDEPYWERGVHPQPTCSSCAVPGCDSQCQRSCGYWGGVEYLLWWRQGRSLPPLVTTSPDGTGTATAGVLGQPTTTILFGDERDGGEVRPGGRVTIGTWLDDWACAGVAGRFFALGDGRLRFTRNSGTTPILARPFFDVDLGAESTNLVAHPSRSTGSIEVVSNSDVMGADVYWRRLLARGPSGRVDLVAGYLFSRIDEDLLITTQTTVTSTGTLPIGTTLSVADLFETRNEFHAGEFGLLSELQRGPFWFEALTKVALGNMRQEVLVAGRTQTFVPPNSNASANSGLLAQPSNSGRAEQNKFAVMPEVSLRMGYQLSQHVDVSLGYSFLYWSSVVQPGDQIDRNIDLDQPAAGPPTMVIRDSDYWVQGLNLGLEWQY